MAKLKSKRTTNRASATSEEKGFNAPQQIAFLNGGQGYSRRIPGDYQLLYQFLTNSLAYHCVSLNANAISTECIHFYRASTSTNVTKYRTAPVGLIEAKRLKKGRRIAKSATVEEVLDHPLSEIITQRLKYLTAASLDVLGRTYWLIRDLPDDITFLQAQWIQPIRDNNGIVTGYIYRKDNGKAEQKFNLDEVAVFRFPLLTDPEAGGHSPLASVYADVLLTSQFADYMNTLLTSRGRPDAILSPKGEIGDEEAKRLIKKFEDKFRGTGNGRVMISDSQLNYTPLSFPPTDLAPIEIDEAVQKRICKAFGQPIALFDKDANRANADAAQYVHARYGIEPRALLIETVINDQILKAFGDDSVFCAFDDIIPEDREYQLKAVASVPGVRNGVLVNEWRAMADLPPTPDGDTIYAEPNSGAATASQTDSTEQPADADAEEEANEPELEREEEAADEEKTFDIDAILKLNREVSEGSLPRATAINIAEAAGYPNAKNLIGYSSAPKVKECTCCDPKVTESNEQKAKHPDRVPAAWREKIVPKLKAFFDKQSRAVLAKIEKGFNSDVITKAALPDDFIDLSEWDEDLAHEIQPVIELFAKESGSDTLARIGASPDVFSVTPAKIDEAIEKISLRFAKSTNDTTSVQLSDALDKLREELRQGLIEGEPIAELRKRVQSVFDNADAFRAEKIAQTEASRAIHKGQQIAAKESGVVKGFKLLLSDDACEICQLVADVTPEIGLDGTFSDGSYDDSPLPVHPNCRCTMLEILDDGSKGEGEENSE